MTANPVELLGTDVKAAVTSEVTQSLAEVPQTELIHDRFYIIDPQKTNVGFRL